MDNICISDAGSLFLMKPDDIISFPGSIYLPIDNWYVAEKDSTIIHRGKKTDIKAGQIILTFYSNSINSNGDLFIIIENEILKNIILSQQNANKNNEKDCKEI